MKELKIGDKLKDNDPRMPNRALLEIIDLCDGNRITARTGIGAYVKVSVQRIHADGKKRRSGFDLVREDLWRCTVCGRIGTVGRCCGEETREPVRAPNGLVTWRQQHEQD